METWQSAESQMTDTRSQILAEQHAWAKSKDVPIDKSGYTETLDANLFQPLHLDTLKDFQRGSGDELGRDGRRGKMRALHSSSALVVNFFDYWRERPPAWLRDALSLTSEPSSMGFEAQFPTGLRGTPPNLDIQFALANKRKVVVELKFTEVYAHTNKPTPFKDKYFPSIYQLWAKCDLPLCQDVAHRLQSAELRFQYLNAAQLLKHILGLAQTSIGPFTLLYIWYDVRSEEAKQHENEIRQFAEAVRTELDFRTITYQKLFQVVERSVATHHPSYCNYLRERYFSSPSSYQPRR